MSKSPLTPARLLLPCLAALLSTTVHAVDIPYEMPAHAPAPAAGGDEPSHPWAADAFVPVTAERIATLPADQQPAWRAYWDASSKRAALLSKRDLIDHSSSKPLPGGPIGSSYSKGVRLGAPADFYA